MPVVLAFLPWAADLGNGPIYWLEAGWLPVALTFCAEVSAVLAVVRILQKESSPMAALDGYIVLISLAAYAIAGFFLFLFSPNNLRLAACSAGIVLTALAIATGRELMQKRTRKLVTGGSGRGYCTEVPA